MCPPQGFGKIRLNSFSIIRLTARETPCTENKTSSAEVEDLQCRVLAFTGELLFCLYCKGEQSSVTREGEGGGRVVSFMCTLHCSAKRIRSHYLVVTSNLSSCVWNCESLVAVCSIWALFYFICVYAKNRGGAVVGTHGQMVPFSNSGLIMP